MTITTKGGGVGGVKILNLYAGIGGLTNGWGSEKK